MKTNKKANKLVAGLALAGLGVMSVFLQPTQARLSPFSAAGDTYKAKCAVCHGADGSGKTPAGQKLSVHDLRAPEVKKKSDAELLTIVSNGKNKMPGYEKTLGKDACSQLVAYIRSL